MTIDIDWHEPPAIVAAAPGWWKLARGWICDIAVNGEIDRAMRLCVPAGFVTDLRMSRNPGPAQLPAVVLHDWLYTCGGTTWGNRYLADRAFYAALRKGSVPFWKAALEYAAVRLFGWIYFNWKREGK